ncbi:unnamed protein product [Prorocentrum cordatum]|uniref:Uncharacterized protein n=1 Tax=Prorocentrum cordatum TaxID=2364126 RepID=A0ABN9W4Y4_9DINO|nr:unnamed protein product [Polarella glacialis]
MDLEAQRGSPVAAVELEPPGDPCRAVSADASATPAHLPAPARYAGPRWQRHALREMAPHAPVVHGLREGTLVRVSAGAEGGEREELEGIGQLGRYFPDRHAFQVTLLDGARAEVPAGHLSRASGLGRPGEGGVGACFDLLWGPAAREARAGRKGRCRTPSSRRVSAFSSCCRAHRTLPPPLRWQRACGRTGSWSGCPRRWRSTTWAAATGERCSGWTGV